jgi:hypothetical protein
VIGFKNGTFMERRFKQRRKTILPISTKTSNHLIQKNNKITTLEIQVLAWYRYKNV